MLSIRSYFSVFKLRIVVLLVFTSCVSAFLAANGRVDFATLLLLVAAGGLSSMGSSALNHYIDRDIDRKMSRTRNRPLVKDNLKASHVLIAGIVLIASALVLAIKINYLTAVFVLSGALTYVVIYSLWLKRTTRLNIVIGGLSGSFAVLSGWSAVGSQNYALAIALALFLFLWTPSHFWSFALANKRDYVRVGVPMLTTVVSERAAAVIILLNTLLLVASSGFLYLAGDLGLLFLAVSVFMGVWFIFVNLKLVFKPRPKTAWTNFKFSGLYLATLFIGMLADVSIKQILQ